MTQKTQKRVKLKSPNERDKWQHARIINKNVVEDYVYIQDVKNVVNPGENKNSNIKYLFRQTWHLNDR